MIFMVIVFIAKYGYDNQKVAICCGINRYVGTKMLNIYTNYAEQGYTDYGVIE